VSGRSTSRVLILTDGDDPWRTPVQENIDLLVPLFWASPESLELLRTRFRAPAVAVSDVIGDLASLSEESFRLASSICRSVPLYRDINPLMGHENRLADLLFPQIAMGRVLSHLERVVKSGSVLMFTQASVWADAAAMSSTFETVVDAPRTGRPSRSPWARSARFLKGVIASRDLRTLFQEPIEMLGPRFRPPRSIDERPGGVWAYSSYVNFSRALARHDSLREVPFRWLINQQSARHGLPAGTSPRHLWDFGGIRRRTGHQIVTAAIADRLRDALTAEQVPRASASEIVGELTLAVADAIREADLQHSFFERARPDEVWVANQWGSELTLAQGARNRSIPIVQVQHGMLEQHYRWAPCYTDRFLVWGEGWRDLLPPETQRLTEVVNPSWGAPDEVRSREATGRRLTFFTTPAVQPLWNAHLLSSEIRQIMQELGAAGWRVTVRVHPNDSIAGWRAAVRDMSASGSGRVRIDQRTDLSDLLAQTDIAVLFRSTVLLGCVVSGIPTIALEWYPWLWDDLLKRTGVVELASSMEGVARASERRGRPTDQRGDIRPLLAEGRD
jgi:hypothetical protein